MSANDIVAIFDKLGITMQILQEAGDSFNFYDKEELANYLTYIPQEDILERLLGKTHSITEKHNNYINELIK